MEKTLGERRVRTDFNVAGSGTVDEIKKKSAELIDLLGTIVLKDGEQARLVAKAQTDFEQGAMWAVKAATY